MTLQPRLYALCAAAGLALLASACASTNAQPTSALAEGSQATVDGIIASIDTQPWTYDGNAVVVLESAANGRVSVQLPARWNLCKAAQVDVQSLVVGQRARAIGTVTSDGSLVVCEQSGHRLAPLGQ